MPSDSPPKDLRCAGAVPADPLGSCLPTPRSPRIGRRIIELSVLSVNKSAEPEKWQAPREMAGAREGPAKEPPRTPARAVPELDPAAARPFSAVAPVKGSAWERAAAPPATSCAAIGTVQMTVSWREVRINAPWGERN